MRATKSKSPRKGSIRSAAMPDAGRKGLYGPRHRVPSAVGQPCAMCKGKPSLPIPSQGEVDAIVRKMKKSFRRIEKEERKAKPERPPLLARRLTPAQRRERRARWALQGKLDLFDRFYAAALQGLCARHGTASPSSLLAQAATDIALKALRVRESTKVKLGKLKIRAEAELP